MGYLLAQAAQQQAEQFDEQFVALLAFGGGALLLFVFVYLFQNTSGEKVPQTGGGSLKTWKKTNRINVTFARLFGLMTVAVLAVALAFAEVGSDAKTAAFTLLGTIAGYLAGARPTEGASTTTTTGGAGAGGGGDGGGDGDESVEVDEVVETVVTEPVL